MNNFERIKQMTVDEMAKYLHNNMLTLIYRRHNMICNCCKFFQDINSNGHYLCTSELTKHHKNCISAIKQYLLQEVEE